MKTAWAAWGGVWPPPRTPVSVFAQWAASRFCEHVRCRGEADLRADYQSLLSRGTSRGGSSSSGLCWCALTRWRAAPGNLTCPAVSPWAGVHSDSFPGGSTPVPATRTVAWGQIWDRQVLGEPDHRGSPGRSWYHNHLDSCSLMPQPPVPAQHHIWNEHKGEMDMTLG